MRSPIVAIAALCVTIARGEPTNEVHLVDLPTALRLAGAQNLDVKIARERLAEAKANHSAALAQFFPWVSPGITYRQHDDKIQDVAGSIIDVNKYSYAPGATLEAQVDIGDALYKSLAAKQLAAAATHALEAQRQELHAEYAGQHKQFIGQLETTVDTLYKAMGVPDVAAAIASDPGVIDTFVQRAAA